MCMNVCGTKQVGGNMLFKSLLVLLLSFTTSVFAQSSLMVSYGHRVIDANHSENKQNTIGIRTKVGDNLFADFGYGNDIGLVSNVKTLRTEAGLSTTYKQLFARVSVGEKKVDRVQGIYYYTAEAGLVIPLTESITTKVSFRSRDAFNSADKDHTSTMRYAAAYRITKQDILELGYDDLKGHGGSNITTYKYIRNF